MRFKAENIAKVVHEANRAYCEILGDWTQKPWQYAEDWQKKSAVSGVEGIISGTITRPEQSHESWLAEKVADGWNYGPAKDTKAKLHPCMVPYSELPEEQRIKDRIFFAVVRAIVGDEIEGAQG